MIPLNLHPYLKPSNVIDSDHPSIVALARQIGRDGDPVRVAKSTSKPGSSFDDREAT